MKSAILAILISLSSFNARADFLERAKSYLIPCLSSLAVGAILSKDEGVAIGTVGCTAVISYGEFGMAPRSELSKEDLDIMRKVAQQTADLAILKNRAEVDASLKTLQSRIDQDSGRNREQIKDLMTDMAVIMEADLSKRMEMKLKGSELMPELNSKIAEKVKEEVYLEMKLQRPKLIDDLAKETVKRVTLDPQEAPVEVAKPKGR